MNSSNIIKSFRGKQLLTQEQVAQKLGFSRQLYNNYENNPLNCPLNIILKILSELYITDEEFEEFLIALKQDYLSYLNNQEKE